MTTQRRRRVPVEVQLEIERLAGEGFGGKAILEHLQQSKKLRDQLPDLRTVQRIVADTKAADLVSGAPVSEPWTAVSDETGEPALVLEVLATLIRHSSGAPIEISRGNAKRFVNLARAAPDLPLIEVWVLTVVYETREQAGQSTYDLDALLALAPWRNGEEGWAAYARLAPRRDPVDWDRSILPGLRTVPAAPAGILTRLRRLSEASVSNAVSSGD